MNKQIFILIILFSCINLFPQNEIPFSIQIYEVKTGNILDRNSLQLFTEYRFKLEMKFLPKLSENNFSLAVYFKINEQNNFEPLYKIDNINIKNTNESNDFYSFTLDSSYLNKNITFISVVSSIPIEFSQVSIRYLDMLQYLSDRNKLIINSGDLGLSKDIFNLEVQSFVIDNRNDANNILFKKYEEISVEKKEFFDMDWWKDIDEHLMEYYQLMKVRQSLNETQELIMSAFSKLFGEYISQSLNDFGEETKILFWGKNYLWLIDNSGIKVKTSSKLNYNELSKNVIQIRNILRHDELVVNRSAINIKQNLIEDGNSSDSNFTSKEKRESVLIEPLRILTSLLTNNKILDELSTAENLIVVPTGAIGIIPFALLKLNDGRFFIDQMTISVAPNLLDLVLQKDSEWNYDFENVLVIGNPDYYNEGEWRFPNLLGAEEEAKNIAEIFNTKPLTKSIAKKSEIINKSRSSSILHIASHGISDPDYPLDKSFIALTPDSSDNGFWTTKEIQSDTINAQLVVLSACQTGLGLAHRGGVIGLARAFQKAGTPRVIMSLWNVNDYSAKELMINFSSKLKKMTPAKALQTSMHELREKFPDPFDWAPFLLFGTPN